MLSCIYYTTSTNSVLHQLATSDLSAAHTDNANSATATSSWHLQRE